MTNTEKVAYLKKIGCDTDSAIERVLGDEDFYIECIDMFIEDNNVNKIVEYVKNEQFEFLFGEFHDLKGVVGNLGFTPLYNITYEIVEMLRHNIYTNLKDKVDSLIKAYDEILKVNN